MTALCACGCGELAPIASKTRTLQGHTKGEPTEFIHGHPFRGRNHAPTRGRHPLSAVDPGERTAFCSGCERRVKVYAHGVSRNGFQQWKCSISALSGMKGYRRHLKQTCERCGFVPVDPCQLDGHHRDRDRANNDPSNIETLCANCHRLEHPRASRVYTHKPLAPTVLERVA